MLNRSMLVVGVLLLASIPCFAGSDPLEGTWKINDAKSSWSDGKVPPNMSLTIKLQIDGNVMKYYSNNDTQKDKPGVISHFEAAMDGSRTFPGQQSF